MASPTLERILHDLQVLLRDFNGKEYSEDIGPETLLFADLGLVSIDAVILAERLEQLYQRQFPFNQFLADLGRERASDIALRRLITFLYDEMNAPTDEGSQCR